MDTVTLLAAPPQRGKRPRPDDLPSSPEDVYDVQPKRTCPELPPLESVCSHLGFLEELCELENPLDSSAAESATQEDLVTEMMKSLEKVIGATEDPSQPHPYVSGSASLPLVICQNPGADGLDFSSPNELSATAPDGRSSESSVSDYSAVEVGIRCLFEAADEELGSFTCSSIEAEDSRQVIGVAESPFTLYDWLDGSFDQMGDTVFDHARECCDLVSLDYCF